MPSNRVWIDLKKIGKKIKKKIKTSLWKKTSKKNKQNINSRIHESSVNTELETNNKCSIEDLHKLNYICFVFLKIIYLHYETNKVDFCIKSIQNNPILADAFRLSYNEFRAKFCNLLIISEDQGENFSLALSRQAEFFSILTHIFGLLPPPFSTLGEIIRLGINEINKKNKVLKSKNILKYCITDENFTKIVSLLFSCILVKNLTVEEDLDLSVKKNFSIFWEILKTQGEQCLNKPSFSENIEKIWAYCFCLFESTAFCTSTVNASDAKLESKQKNSIKNTNQLCGTKFFDTKKFPSIPMRQLPSLHNMSKFWEDKASHVDILSLPEVNPRILPRLAICN